MSEQKSEKQPNGVSQEPASSGYPNANRSGNPGTSGAKPLSVPSDQIAGVERSREESWQGHADESYENQRSSFPWTRVALGLSAGFLLGRYWPLVLAGVAVDGAVMATGRKRLSSGARQVPVAAVGAATHALEAATQAVKTAGPTITHLAKPAAEAASHAAGVASRAGGAASQAVGLAAHALHGGLQTAAEVGAKLGHGALTQAERLASGAATLGSAAGEALADSVGDVIGGPLASAGRFAAGGLAAAQHAAPVAAQRGASVASNGARLAAKVGGPALVALGGTLGTVGDKLSTWAEPPPPRRDYLKLFAAAGLALALVGLVLATDQLGLASAKAGADARP